MSLQSINGAVTSTPFTATKVTDKKEATTKNASASTGFDDTAVVYEKTVTPENTVTAKNNTIDREAIIAQMKADTEARMNQLTSIVQKMMTQQGHTLGLADDMWSFLAKGDFEVSADVKAQAQADIAEDGYWGVNQTSDRILDFAKALSGGDPEKADEMLAAFKKGFEQATETWGGKLPDISQRTYDAVISKFDAWKAESAQAETTTVN